MDYYFLISEEIIENVIKYHGVAWFKRRYGKSSQNLEKDIELLVLRLFKLYRVSEDSLVEVYITRTGVVIKTGRTVLITDLNLKKAKACRDKLSKKRHYLPPADGLQK